jgi:hypothetical protein
VAVLPVLRKAIVIAEEALVLEAALMLIMPRVEMAPRVGEAFLSARLRRLCQPDARGSIQ